MAKTPKKPALPLHKILLALTLGTVGGGAAYYFSIPLPWMLGAMLSTTVAAVCGLPVALPMAFRTAMVGVLGIMLGSGFAPEILDCLGDWTLPLPGRAPYTVVVPGVVPGFWGPSC